MMYAHRPKKNLAVMGGILPKNNESEGYCVRYLLKSH